MPVVSAVGSDSDSAAADKDGASCVPGDSTVRIWDVHTLSPLFVIYPADERVGDIFAREFAGLWRMPVRR